MIRNALFVAGTRPEVIKIAPVIRQARLSGHFDARLAVTAQHRHLLDQALAAFNLKPDFDLDIMSPGQTLSGTASKILAAIEPVLAGPFRPDIAFVQGDTTTTLGAALAAFYARIPVAHIEAGLRTRDLSQPFPEEANRVLTSRVAAIHFAATDAARRNLVAEGIPDSSIHVTGNPGIDAVLDVVNRLESGELPSSRSNSSGKHLIVVTAHRRESFGEGFANICRALRRIASRGDVQIVYPVHPNPNVSGPVRANLSGVPNLDLIDPLDYIPFVDLMRQATLLLTDSGGIQEEGPSLGKPVIVMRDKTERPEAVDAGTVILCGADEDRICKEVFSLLDDIQRRAKMSRIHNPYGDGHASERIVEATRSFLGER